MKFPSRIDSQRHAGPTRATMRLKYMLQRAALDHFGRPSMHDLAREAGCNHSSIFNAIERGYFTEEMALKIEQVFGRKALPHEWLTQPLAIEAKA